MPEVELAGPLIALPLHLSVLQRVKVEQLQIFVGWDPREDIAWRVCRHSILSRTNPDLVKVQPLVQSELRRRGLYWRPVDQQASTEFSLTRFLTPTLAGNKGYAIFMDCDFLLQIDILKVLEEVDPKNAVSVVQHNYSPVQGIKMDGQVQFVYPRKNWSSFILFNLEHQRVRDLTAHEVNTRTPAYLHRFDWLEDSSIGSLNPTWNHLVGWYPSTPSSPPNAIHFTEGGPWFQAYKFCDYASLWNDELSHIANDIKDQSCSPNVMERSAS